MIKALAGLFLLLASLSPALAQKVVPPDDTANCAFNTSPPTVATGSMVRIQCDSSGRLILSPSGSSTPVTGTTSNASDGVATSATNIPTVSYNYVWDAGTTSWDRFYGNTAGAFVQGNVASGTADSGNPNKVGCVFNSTLPTLTAGQRGDCQFDTRAGLYTVIKGVNSTNAAQVVGFADATTNAGTGLLASSFGSVFNGTTWDRQRGTLANGTFVSPGGFSFSHITTAATTTAKSGAGSVHTICVNSLGTVASSITVYDNTAGSGTVIGIINSLALLGCQTYDVAFATGLTLVTTGTVAPDVTVSYR